VLRPSVRSAAQPRLPNMQKTLATRRGSLRSSVAGASVALVPPRSSVLPPGAGNEEAKKALKAGKKRAKKIEERYVLGLEVAHGHGDAAPIGRHDDGDAAAAVTLEEVQATRLLYTRWGRGSRSVAPVSVQAQPPQPQRSPRSAPSPLPVGPGAIPADRAPGWSAVDDQRSSPASRRCRARGARCRRDSTRDSSGREPRRRVAPVSSTFRIAPRTTCQRNPSASR
jgi:hypothetical protein